MKRIVTLADYAKFKGVTRQTAHKWAIDNKIPVRKIGSRFFIIINKPPKGIESIMDDEYLNLQEAADLIGVSKTTMSIMVRANEVATRALGNNKFIIKSKLESQKNDRK
uniref:hypothetical protein n=1 Tax=Piscirickettsia salmonis TaxID=1238 RepID=UPI0039F6DC4A